VKTNVLWCRLGSGVAHCTGENKLTMHVARPILHLFMLRCKCVAEVLCKEVRKASNLALKGVGLSYIRPHLRIRPEVEVGLPCLSHGQPYLQIWQRKEQALGCWGRIGFQVTYTRDAEGTPTERGGGVWVFPRGYPTLPALAFCPTHEGGGEKDE